MSSLNVRLARKTRGKTDLLNRTNVPGSDGARHDHRAVAGARARAGAGLVQGGMTAEPTPARVLAMFAGTRLGGGKQEGLRQDCAEQDHWGEAADYEKVTSM